MSVREDSVPHELASAALEPIGRAGFLLVFACLLSMGVGQSIAFSVLPPITRDLGLADSSVALVHSVPAMLWAVTAPLWGRYSDRHGRRNVIVIGFVGWGLSSLLFAFSIQAALWGSLALTPALIAMVASRSIFGLTTSGGVAAAQAYVAERTSRRERTSTMAMLGSANMLGTILGPGLGALLVVIGLVAPFYTTAFVALGAAILVWFYLPEARKRTALNEPRVKQRWLSPMDTRIMPFLISDTSTAIVQIATMSTVGFYFADVLSIASVEAAQLVGGALMINAGCAMISQLVIVQRFKPSATTMLRLGAILVVGGNLIFLMADGYWFLVGALAVLGFGFGLLAPGNMAGISLTVETHELGAANGLMASVRATGFAASPLFALPLYEVMQTGPYIVNVLVMTVVCGVVWLHPTMRRIGAEHHLPN